MLTVGLIPIDFMVFKAVLLQFCLFLGLTQLLLFFLKNTKSTSHLTDAFSTQSQTIKEGFINRNPEIPKGINKVKLHLNLKG